MMALNGDSMLILTSVALLISVILNSLLMTRWLYKISMLWEAQTFFHHLDRDIALKMDSAVRGARHISDLKKDLDFHVQLCKKQIQTMKSRAILFEKRINAANLSPVRQPVQHLHHAVDQRGSKLRPSFDMRCDDALIDTDSDGITNVLLQKIQVNKRAR